MLNGATPNLISVERPSLGDSNMPTSMFKHPLSPISKRSLIAVTAIAVVMIVGTIGTRFLAGYSWIYSFYFMSMVATAQGPPGAPPNFWSMVFISIMAFISIGTLITSIGTLFGPFLGYVFHKGMTYAQMEIEKEKSAKSKNSPEPD
jgi:hypothetical protein